jgi:hypothetical protein
MRAVSILIIGLFACFFLSFFLAQAGFYINIYPVGVSAVLYFGAFPVSYVLIFVFGILQDLATQQITGFSSFCYLMAIFILDTFYFRYSSILVLSLFIFLQNVIGSGLYMIINFIQN